MAKKVGNPGIVDTQRQGITDVPNPDVNVAATGSGTARKAAGTSVYTNVSNVSGVGSPNTTRVPRKNARQGNAGLGPTGHRSPTTADRLGPAFAPRATMCRQIDPSAGATQANGRIVPPAVIRSGASFASGNQASY